MTDTTTPTHHRDQRCAQHRAQHCGRNSGRNRGQHRRHYRGHRRGVWWLAASGVALLAALATACTTTSAPTSEPGRTGSPPPSTSSPPTVTEVPQPAAGQTGPALAVTGTAYWVAIGYPGCAMLHTTHGQVLELVDAPHSPRGPVVQQRQQAAAAGHAPTRQAVQVIGYVPAGVVSACGAAMSLSVEQ